MSLWLLPQDRRRREPGGKQSRCADQGRHMRLVTYDAGQGPRVGILEGDAILDAGFDGDMIAFIEAGAPVGSQTPVESAQLLSPLRPRPQRDFLAFEGHLKNAFRRLGRPIPDEWYEVPAFYRGMPDTVIGQGEAVAEGGPTLHREVGPRAGARRHNRA